MQTPPSVYRNKPWWDDEISDMNEKIQNHQPYHTRIETTLALNRLTISMHLAGLRSRYPDQSNEFIRDKMLQWLGYHGFDPPDHPDLVLRSTQDLELLH